LPGIGKPGERSFGKPKFTLDCIADDDDDDDDDDDEDEDDDDDDD
jgi:hypothetical protein